MKICEKEKERVQLTYKILNWGDIFKFDQDDIAVCQRVDTDGYIVLATGTFWANDSVPDHKSVTRYPNACITLGDPE